MVHLSRWTVAAAALLAVTVGLAAADVKTFPPDELPIVWEDRIEDMMFPNTSPSNTEPTEPWNTDVTESPHNTDSPYSSNCPPADLNFTTSCISIPMCMGDDSCPKDHVCCPNGCGGVDCVYPVINGSPPPIFEDEIIYDIFTEPKVSTVQYNPRCPPVHQNYSVSCSDIINCVDDESCSGNEVCCPNDCGGLECTYPIIKGPLPPIDEEEENSTTDEMELTTESPYDRIRDLNEWDLPERLGNDKNAKLRCPTPSPLDSQNEDLCAGSCHNCREDQMCCPNNCGGMQCMDAVNDELSETEGPPVTGPPVTEPHVEAKIPEKGTKLLLPEVSLLMPVMGISPYLELLHLDSPLCPKLNPKIRSPCTEMCSPWGNPCPEGQVCCRNNCGARECMNAVSKEQPTQKEKEQFFWELYAKNSIHQYEKENVI